MVVLFLLGLLIGLVLIEVVEIASRRWQPLSSLRSGQPLEATTEASWTALDDRQFARAVRESSP